MAIRTYQVVAGPIFGGACRFEPSCSHYAIEAARKLPVGEAVIKITLRLCRCRPGGGFGWDPVITTRRNA